MNNVNKKKQTIWSGRSSLIVVIMVIKIPQVKRDLLRRVSRLVDRDVVIASSSLRLPLGKVSKSS